MKVISIVTIVFCIVSCKGKSNISEETKNSDSTKFFQVTEFLKSQISDVNKTPYFIYKLDNLKDKKDSIVINSAEFNSVANQFLQPDINDPSLKKYYTENVFFDQTTKSYTISYATNNKELEIQNVDVLLKEDAKTVKRILIRKFKNYSDSSAIEQLSWKPNESFQVNRSVQKDGDKNEISQQTVVVWNEKG